ncbi:hypothetical protein EYF80_010350 [Liparis tanakae]|uniref:Uncharacterized protein n=1 Tax=Liparis tanakae TaxID=230148 RepID=A0A4Z2INI1_9TELE|nr:hypothetical protein EYF80_010350 [Liparis tanakae]
MMGLSGYLNRRMSTRVTRSGELGEEEDGLLGSDVFWPTQISPAPWTGKASQRSRSGHWKPNLFMRASHPWRARSHRDRHGGMACSSTVQTGAYMEQRKNFRSAEHCTLTRG